MLRRTYFLALSLLLGPVIGFAGKHRTTPRPSQRYQSSPLDLISSTSRSSLKHARLLQAGNHAIRRIPFGEVAVAASYLFEELHLQGVLTSDFFLNEKRFLHGIDGRPDPERMKPFPRSAGSRPRTC